jgi:hypothetical protein
MNISSWSRDIAKRDTLTGRVQLREATEERGVQVVGQRSGAVGGPMRRELENRESHGCVYFGIENPKTLMQRFD